MTPQLHEDILVGSVTESRPARGDAAAQGEGDRMHTEPSKNRLRDFSALVSEYRKPLYRFVLRHIGQPADAEDIAQQTFVEAYKALATFRGDSELSTWIYGIAMNLVRNYLNRAPHRVRKFESDQVLESLPADSDGPDAVVQRMELLTRLYAEVGALSADLQQTFLLIAIEGRSYEEVAQLLAIPIGTVRSRLFRAREVIKNRLPELQESLRP
ncbi:MAG: sigma-70 family RNA polymerase sigma factor [Gammaproteobacteria bacterium]